MKILKIILAGILLFFMCFGVMTGHRIEISALAFVWGILFVILTVISKYIDKL